MNKADAVVFGALFKTAWGVVGPYLKAIFTRVHHDPDPVGALGRALRQSKGALSGVAGILAGVGGAAGGGAIAVATMGFWTGIGYWLGAVSMPLLWPVVGALVAAGGVGGAVYAMLSKLDDQNKLRLATLYAHSLTVVVFQAGETASDSQLAKFKDRIVASGVPAPAVTELFQSAPRAVDNFDVDPSPFSPDTIHTVLTEVWLAAETVHRDNPEAAESFDRLCARLGVGGQAVNIREKARTIMKDGIAGAPAVATAAAYVAPDILNVGASLFEDLLAADFTGNALRRRGEILKSASTLAAAASAIAAVATGNPAILAIIAEGYAVARAASAGDSEEGEKARGRAMELLSQLGVGREKANGYLHLIDGVIDDTKKQVEKAAKARK